ncbi:MAG TPA: deoxyribodipyrimidine photo-lyase [Candidatus Cybelea sp.]|nr:deoxyribodipyrimidine photo-lyase [Candidatus Cybelea sp.]
MAERPFIYRFSTDLRLEDHAGLAAAASRGGVLPIIVIDDALASRLSASPRRAAFFCSAVCALAAELQEMGSRLVVRRGPPGKIVAEIARATGADGAAWMASYHAQGIADDRRLQSELEEAGLAALVVHDAPVIPPEESAAARGADGAGYRAFAPYFERWWKLGIASFENPLLLRFTSSEADGEALPQPSEFGSGDECPVAGAPVARVLLERFLEDRAAQYGAAGAIPSENGTSQLSAHISFGTISARTIARRVRERLGDPFSLGEERVSLRLFLRALARRDFFLQLSWFYPDAIEALQEKMQGFALEQDHPALDAWRAGKTGYPLVDAGIRQLHQTGWMHPHVRAVAASLLCFDLSVDWRVGREEWNRWLVEDDPAVATGNWQWIAGVGADMAQFPRIYNPERQRRRYDPDGTYVRRWIPELRHIPREAWHGRADDSPQLSLSLFEREAYPQPVVDHAVAARAFLTRYRAFVSP